MLDGGEDPLFIARRLMRAASEDIGEADPLSLLLANAARTPTTSWARRRASWRWRSWLCTWPPRPSRTPCSPPSARPCARRGNRLADAAGAHPERPTRLMKELGYGKGYAPTTTSRPRASLARTISRRGWGVAASTSRRARAPKRAPRSAWSAGRRCARELANGRHCYSRLSPDEIAFVRSLKVIPRGRAHPGVEQAGWAVEPR